MPLDDLFAEAERQMNVCNSCRYCEGYCAVWPALELRTELTKGDLTHLANLCHDCRDCFTACMYTAPHEFDLNPPKVFTEIRTATYTSYVWPRNLPRPLRGAAGTAVSAVVIGLVLLGLSVLTTDGLAFATTTSGSPYELLPYWLMLLVVGLPALWSAGVGLYAVAGYWRDTHGRLGDLASPRVWAAALRTAVTLRHMRGGGEEECAYPTDQPTPARRRFHGLTFWGFLLCLLSTMAAGVEQDFLGIDPPYPPLSVPVVSGTAGGVAMIVGCAGLLALKRRAAPEQGTETMRRADHGLLGALLVLAVTGVLTLVLRETAAFGAVLLIHLAAIVVCFGVAPYTKFVHWVYRLLAVYQDEWEHRTADR
ncbi:MAG TPA: tricarballylate utilization 4Fe-4S protein TcuB [Streptosporangiaceae bacterium]|jgi:citrate/tricarballylate utilization protein